MSVKWKYYCDGPGCDLTEEVHPDDPRRKCALLKSHLTSMSSHRHIYASSVKTSSESASRKQSFVND